MNKQHLHLCLEKNSNHSTGVLFKYKLALSHLCLAYFGPIALTSIDTTNAKPLSCRCLLKGILVTHHIILVAVFHLRPNLDQQIPQMAI
jgi:hypothetical protein